MRKYDENTKAKLDISRSYSSRRQSSSAVKITTARIFLQHPIAKV